MIQPHQDNVLQQGQIKHYVKQQGEYGIDQVQDSDQYGYYSNDQLEERNSLIEQNSRRLYQRTNKLPKTIKVKTLQKNLQGEQIKIPENKQNTIPSTFDSQETQRIMKIASFSQNSSIFKSENQIEKLFDFLQRQVIQIKIQQSDPIDKDKFKKLGEQDNLYIIAQYTNQNILIGTPFHYKKSNKQQIKCTYIFSSLNKKFSIKNYEKSILTFIQQNGIDIDKGYFYIKYDIGIQDSSELEFKKYYTALTIRTDQRQLVINKQGQQIFPFSKWQAIKVIYLK